MLKRIISHTWSSVLFLSRLPLPVGNATPLPDFSRSTYTFPLAGMIIALPAAFVLWGANVTGLAPVICALMAVAALIVTTGALHEDGLADVADGFWGGATVKRKLDIMRDSTIGTFGTLALVLVTGLRILLLGEIIDAFGGFPAALLFVAVAGVSRHGMLWPWYALPAARNQFNVQTEENEKPAAGLSQQYGAPDFDQFLRATLAALPAVVMLLVIGGIAGLLLSFVMWALGVFALTRFSKHHISGHTGDTLGATQQICELGLLLGLVWAM